MYMFTGRSLLRDLFLRGFALTRHENLHLLNLRDNVRFNAVWNAILCTCSVVSLVLYWRLRE